MRDGFTVSIEDVGPELDRRLCSALVSYLGRNSDGGACVVHIRRRQVSPPMGDVDRARHREPHVAIDAGAGIPARGVGLRLQPDREHVLAIPAQVGRQVQREARVAIRPLANLMPVEPDVSVGHGAVELDGEVVALRLGRQHEVFAVPTRARYRQAAGVGVVGAVEGPFDRPIVWQRERAPLRVVIVRALGARGFAFEEAPVVVEADATLVLKLDEIERGGTGRGRGGKDGGQHQTQAQANFRH